MPKIIIRGHERKLLPADENDCLYQFKCLSGEGYLRRMTDSYRVRVKRGTLFKVEGGNVATMSAVSDMILSAQKE